MIECRYQYSSPLKEYFHAFLNFKASKEQDVSSYAFFFKHIDEFLVGRKYGKAYIDRDIYKEWLRERTASASPATVSCECSKMRSFLIFTTKMGNECYIPMPRTKPGKTYIPHVFSHDELASLFNAADSLRLRNRCTCNQLHAVPALLRLLYSTGMRLGEALGIRNKDVDMKANIIKLRTTKSGHERISPINETLKVVLLEYLRNRSRITAKNIGSPDGYFFLWSQRRQMQSRRDTEMVPLCQKEDGHPVLRNRGWS